MAYGVAACAMVYLSYSLPRLLPGDFITAMYSSSHLTLSAEQEQALRAIYSESEGFGRYLAKLARLDWGYSYVFGAPISALILEALPWTLFLTGSAHVISMLRGLIGGVEAAWRRGGRLE